MEKPSLAGYETMHGWKVWVYNQDQSFALHLGYSCTPIYADRPEQCMELHRSSMFWDMFLMHSSFLVSYPSWVKLHFWCGSSKLHAIYILYSQVCVAFHWCTATSTASNHHSGLPLISHHTLPTIEVDKAATHILGIFHSHDEHIHIPIYFLTSCLSWK